MRTDAINNRVAHYNCFGVGAGPSNLSVACLLHEHPDVTHLFVDKKSSPTWHDGQLTPSATLQTSILKDLVTLANPTSRYSFLSYLHEAGRIYHFINAQFDAVPRSEFRNYLAWASRLNRNVAFGEDVLSVRFARGVFVVQTSARTLTADNITVGVGTVPSVPPHVLPSLGPTQFHVSDFVDRAPTLAGRRVAVIGGGQSGAEAVLDLISRPNDELPTHVLWVSRRVNFLPIDDSPFANEYYMPAYSEFFSRLESALRVATNSRNLLASDGVSMPTLRSIYQSLYKHRFVAGRDAFFSLYPNREVTRTRPSPAGWTLTLVHNDGLGAECLDVDVVVWATGFVPAPLDFLSPISARFESENEEYRIDADYAIQWDGPPDRRVFLLNGARRQRGLSDVALSLLAWRSQRVVNRLRGVVAAESHATSFVEWSPTWAGSTPISERMDEMNTGLELRVRGTVGDGVFATRPFSAGEAVVVGVIETELDVNNQHASQIGPGRFVMHGGYLPKVNHSCEPNCGIRENETGAHDLVARRPIEAGEEITYDYAMGNYTVDFFPTRCRCGEPNCRGRITGWKDLPVSRRAAYHGFVAQFLVDEVVTHRPDRTPTVA